jgi:hypothetical protein
MGCVSKPESIFLKFHTSKTKNKPVNTNMIGSDGRSVLNPPGNSTSIEKGNKKKKAKYNSLGLLIINSAAMIPIGINAGIGLYKKIESPKKRMLTNEKSQNRLLSENLVMSMLISGIPKL